MMKNFGFYLLLFFAITACKRQEEPERPKTGPTPYDLQIPSNFAAMPIPADNPVTEEGVALGKKLFYDPILSGDNTQSCGSCHRQNFAFTDSTTRFSKGITGAIGTRNAMPVFNLGWSDRFFWDGGAADLESQVIGPITNPVEMHEDLNNAITELKAIPAYRELFKKAFGSDTITTKRIMQAVAQFERTMISGNSRYDKWERKEAGGTLTAQELRGMQLYIDDKKGDCTHCHTIGSLFTDNEFKNTGLDMVYADAGLYNITLKNSDSGKFKTPSLRNIELTSPYMHDGRFSTLEEVLNHYDTGFRYHNNIDPNLALLPKGRLTEQDKKDIIAFLKTLTDHEFINNPKFKP